MSNIEGGGGRPDEPENGDNNPDIPASQPTGDNKPSTGKPGGGNSSDNSRTEGSGGEGRTDPPVPPRTGRPGSTENMPRDPEGSPLFNMLRGAGRPSKANVRRGEHERLKEEATVKPQKWVQDKKPPGT